MFLFKYERFIHDFVGFNGCLLDPETKSKERAKWSFFQDFIHSFAQASNQFAWANQISSTISNTLTWVNLPTPLGCFFFINSHAYVEENQHPVAEKNVRS